MTTVDCWFADVELADPDRFVGSLSAEFGAVCGLPCGASGVGAAADAMVSLLDGGKLVCGRRELCTTPGRGSAGEASLGEEVELVWASTGLCTLLDVEADEEPAAEADEFVLGVGPVDDGLAADPDAGREADDDEPGDELEEDESDDELEEDESDDELEEDESDDELEELLSCGCGSANATAGVFATAAPTPSANANAPARTMYCAFTGIALGEQPAWAPAEPPESA